MKLLLFNFFTKQAIKRYRLPIFSNRMQSMSVDFAYCLAVVFPFAAILMVPMMIYLEKSMNFEIYSIFASAIFVPILMLILNKDFYASRSVAKRVHGYKIIDTETGKDATAFKCMLRNITLFVSPIEVIAIMISPSRRIGDLIARTKIVEAEKIKPETILDDIKNLKPESDNRKAIIASLIISILISIAMNPTVFMKLLN